MQKREEYLPGAVHGTSVQRVLKEGLARGVVKHGLQSFFREVRVAGWKQRQGGRGGGQRKGDKSMADGRVGSGI